MSNKGKTYIKLTGAEVPTPEAEKRAKSFLGWFALRLDHIKGVLIYKEKLDEDLLIDTALTIRDAILYRNLIIKGKYKWYYLRSYHTNYIAVLKKRKHFDDIDTCLEIGEPDSPQYTEADLLRWEILEYVDSKFPPAESSVFEIWVSLEMTPKRMSIMLGLDEKFVKNTITLIQSDVARTFAEKRKSLLK